jgi:uncharacterized RDD family membrane protein YckC
MSEPRTNGPFTAPGPPPGWYPDPSGSGALRWFDGSTWTALVAPPPMPYGYVPGGPPPWKGAQLGLPQSGPGALASPARRLGARALDALLLLPVLGAFLASALVIAVPRAGPMFPNVAPGRNGRVPTPGFVWVELAVLAAIFATWLVGIAYETVMTARYGRTLGKAWLHIRAVRSRGEPLGWWRSLARGALVFLAATVNWIGLLDYLWCLWDGTQQCVHDKIVDTVVVNDPAPPGD